jgi:hypothetical protein
MANAALTINYEIGAGPVLNCGSGPDDGPVICTFTGGGVTVAVVTSTSNSPGTPSVAEQFGDTVEVTSTGTQTVKIWLTAQDFTSPKGSLYESSLSTTATAANSQSTAALTGCIDTTNGTAPALGCAGGSLTNAPETLMGSGALSNTVSAGVGPLATPYSLQEQVTLTLRSGSDFNVITSQSIAVPEPGSMMLLGTVLIGITTLLRKRAARRSV